ncbi:type II toxin-antitoxin system Phd/YefM family antitoxin [Roseomonas sp. CCTCC AB2023176]|uniref:type II toxin-antitoxin system Phd/YefM family antitoxin n=1 Tax=Roseomonas sp. CCTCC AB2023176 TaxID=3342640 RepID=UPI0035DBBE60
MTSRAFNQDTGSAKRPAREGPVRITDRDKPSQVLMTIHEYERLAAGAEPNALDLFGMVEPCDVEFDPKLSREVWSDKVTFD